MKTVSEVAKELNVSPQAVYKKIKQFKQQLKNHLNKGERGEILIDLEGQGFLKDSFKPVQQLIKQVDNQVDNQLIELFNAQLKAKDEQIGTLTAELNRANQHNREMAVTLAELNRNNQVLLKQSQDKLLPEPKEPEEKKGILKKIFRKN